MKAGYQIASFRTSRIGCLQINTDARYQAVHGLGESDDDDKSMF